MVSRDPSIEQAAGDAEPPREVPDLRAFYEHALETGQAGELVRELCRALGVNLRGLAELSGISQRTLLDWKNAQQHGHRRTLRDLESLVAPEAALLLRVEQIRATAPYGTRGRPRNR